MTNDGQFTAPEPAATDLPRLSGHIPALDGIRGLAILMVTAYRFNIGPDMDSPVGRALANVLKQGYLGVDLFFVLSGFLITGILFDAKQHDRYFRNFYARRALRIFPLYYGFLFVMLVALPAVFGSQGNLFPKATEHQAWLWFYGANFLMGLRNAWCLGSFEHFWSLSIEEHFYLVWPLVIFFCSRRQAMWASLAAIAVSALGRILWLRSGGGGVAVEMFTFFRLDGLGLGAFLALCARGPQGIKPLVKWALIGVVVFGAAQLAILPGMRRLLGLRWTITAVFFGSVLVLAVVSHSSSTWGRFWGSRTLGFFGKYSYAMYVFQLPLIRLVAPIVTSESVCASMGSVLLGRLVYLAVMTALTTGCAYLSWHLYEKHFLSLKTRFS